MPAIARVTPSQIAELSGLVFGLALAISALQLALNPPVAPYDLISWILEFVVSFVILVWMWMSLIRVTRNVRVEYEWMVFLNVAILLFAALEPYPLFLTWAATFDSSKYAAVQDISAAAWAVDIGLMFIVLGALTYFARNDQRRLPTPEAASALERLAYWRFGCGIAMVLTALPVFWSWKLSTGFFGQGPPTPFPIIVHARMIAWIPVLIAAAVGSAHYLNATDRAAGSARTSPNSPSDEDVEAGE